MQVVTHLYSTTKNVRVTRTQSIMKENNLQKSTHRCTLHEILDIIGGKWAIPIIFTLFQGTKRFNELQKQVHHINTRMLVKELKHLHANGIIHREAIATVPPTVNYSLTTKGQDLKPALEAILQWGKKNL